MGLDEVAVLDEIDLVNDMDQDWIDDRSEPEVEFEPEAEQTLAQKLTNLRVLEWLHDLPTDPKETILTIQDVDKDGIKYISHDNTESNWVAPDGPLRLYLELTERVEVDDETLPYAQRWIVHLYLCQGSTLTFHSPWKHARAREEKTRKNTIRTARISL